MRPVLESSSYIGGKIQKVNLATGEFTLYSECNGIALRGPNDIVFDKEGNFWFTDLVKQEIGPWIEVEFTGLKPMGL